MLVMMLLVFVMTFMFTAAGAGVVMHLQVLLAPVRLTWLVSLQTLLWLRWINRPLLVVLDSEAGITFCNITYNIQDQISAPPAPLANSATMSTLTIHCQWEDVMVRVTVHLPSCVEAKKMKLLTLHSYGCPRAILRLLFFFKIRITLL